MQAVAIIAGAGRGERFGGGLPKLLHTIHGQTVLEWSLAAFDANDRIRSIIVVLAPELIDRVGSTLQTRTPLRVIGGGTRRQDSVAAGIEAVEATTEFVVIHDAARPFCTPRLITATLDAAVESGAAIAALVSHDTVKEATAIAGQTVVRRTLNRDAIYLAQTPQAFRLSVLREAVAQEGAGGDATDEASLVERAGHPVRLVEGDARNIKITTPEDLARVREMVGGGAGPATTRVGAGYDLHRFVDGRRLVLGGVSIPGDRGLQGHSDADAVCHAVTDAILGAAGAGDIGEQFPDSDVRWKDASSVDMLAQAAARVRELGFAVGNVDVTVITEWPKIRPYADLMRQEVAAALGSAPDRVSIKGKTNEGVGEVGRGEALAVHAIAALYPRPVDE